MVSCNSLVAKWAALAKLSSQFTFTHYMRENDFIMIGSEHANFS